MLSRTLAFLLVALPTAGLAADDGWARWEHELRRQCPSHHVDWICGDCYDDLIGGFSATLPAATRRKSEQIADYSRRCARETMGFSCEMAVYLDAFRRLGLLKRFTAFGCNAYRCEDVAICAGPAAPLGAARKLSR
jgi:hypothetical protein